MLRSANAIVGLAVRARDGEAGTVSDLLFDDRDFTVRWVVIDTGNWLPGRKVLVPPDRTHVADGAETLVGPALSVEQTREEIENGPGIDRDAPVSRRH